MWSARDFASDGRIPGKLFYVWTMSGRRCAKRMQRRAQRRQLNAFSIETWDDLLSEEFNDDCGLDDMINEAWSDACDSWYDDEPMDIDEYEYQFDDWDYGYDPFDDWDYRPYSTPLKTQRQLEEDAAWAQRDRLDSGMSLADILQERISRQY